MIENYLENVRDLFRYYRQLGEQAIAQLEESEISRQSDESTNSAAIIVKHLSGNMLSRWTDFLSTDGEKEWRHRDREFDNDIHDKAQLIAVWNTGWDCLENALSSLKADDCQKLVYIRNEGHTVVEAINRQLAHYSYHVGQLVFLAKLYRGDSWNCLSVPKGGTAAYNRDKFSREKSRGSFLKERKEDDH